jgi:hypothetical protein
MIFRTVFRWKGRSIGRKEQGARLAGALIRPMPPGPQSYLAGILAILAPRYYISERTGVDCVLGCLFGGPEEVLLETM